MPTYFSFILIFLLLVAVYINFSSIKYQINVY